MTVTEQLGQNWILLTGLTRESGHWGVFPSLLHAAFPSAAVTLLDLPGTGRYFAETSPDTIEAITDRVRDHAAAQCVLHTPATVIGLSLGALVAWRWLRAYPGEIAGAVLICPSFAGLSPFYQRVRWQSYGKIAALAVERSLRAREAAILQLISNRRESYPPTVDEWEDIQKKRPVHLKNAFRHLIAAARYDPGCVKPGCPLLVLNTEGDRLVSPACAVAVRDKWGLELRTHHWAGHDLPRDDPAWVIEQLRLWLQNRF